MHDRKKKLRDRLRMTRIHEQMYLEFNQQNKIQHKLRT